MKAEADILWQSGEDRQVTLADIDYVDQVVDNRWDQENV